MSNTPENTKDEKNLAAPKRSGGAAGAREEGAGEFVKTAAIAILLALFIRTFFYEPFNIPSGSMLPTLEVGDYLFVSKPSYGYSRYSFPFGLADFSGRMMGEDPQRGDVIVFRLPSNPSIDYIKRLVGMPGERIQMRGGRLYINGVLVEREVVGLRRISSPEGGVQNVTEYVEILPNNVMYRIYEESDEEALDNTPEFIIPEDHYFFMGDNRDNSQDSRVRSLVGFVPRDNLVGRAEILFFSVDETASLFKPWTWPSAIRYERIFNRLGPVQAPAGQDQDKPAALVEGA